MTILLACAAALAVARRALPGEAGAAPAHGVDAARTAELVAVGKAIYREGRLPSGKPATAVVLGDVPVEGDQSPCVHCHQRSGLGTSEGNRGALPVTGSLLYRARTSAYRPRPAYTDATLAMAIRVGVDAVGRALDPLMPRYALSDPEMDGLLAYLKTLSTEPSPGVTGSTIHLATVIAGDVDPARRRAMLDVLETCFEEKNRQTRAQDRRSAHGPFFLERSNKAYRRWSLHRWVLNGAPETWPGQLEAYYRREPVFALVSGIGRAEWGPVHAFCEANQVPCLLPNTDLPAIVNGDDFYTLYFSRGVTLEADAVAADVARRVPAAAIVQMFRPDTAGAVAARALRRHVTARPGTSVTDWAVLPNRPLTVDDVAARVKAARANVLVLWLDDASALLNAPWEGQDALRVYLSSTLLGAEIPSIPRTSRATWLVAHPYRLPDDLAARMRRLRTWLDSRKIALRDPRIQSQTYFACVLVGDGLARIRQLFYRDYLLDSLDHADAMATFSVHYPRLSFGPGQRYLAKGSYILELGRGEAGPVVAQTSWVVPLTERSDPRP